MKKPSHFQHGHILRSFMIKIGNIDFSKTENRKCCFFEWTIFRISIRITENINYYRNTHKFRTKEKKQWNSRKIEQ